ncbi:MAG: hypothetical protein ACREQW_20635 [Candidatus Binatia bacterium]
MPGPMGAARLRAQRSILSASLGASEVPAFDGNGGSIIQAKHLIGLYRHRVIILDSEASRLALRSDDAKEDGRAVTARQG